jgi:putative membrane protein
MIQGIRTLSRWIWILVKEEDGNDMLEKKSAINLLLAYAVACKHYLREEYSYEYDDLRPLIGHLPKMFKEPHAKHKTHNSSAINYAPPTNIPLQISYYIGIYIDSVRKKEKWDTSVSGMLLNALNSLVDCLSGFERIKRTPIPLSYSVHLYHVIWLYILSLPFQLIAGLDWWTIPSVTLCSFTFIGILHIGSEIEDPFGFGANDLPLDDLCKVLSMEMRDIMSTKLPTSEELYLSDEYFPIEGSSIPSRALARKTVVEFKALLNQIIEDDDDDKHDEQEEQEKQNQNQSEV